MSVHRSSLPELPEAHVIKLGDIRIDTERGEVSRGRRAHRVGPPTQRLLEMFAKYPRRMLSEERLRIALYGDEVRGEDIIRQYIFRLRGLMRRLGSQSEIRGRRNYGWEFLPRAE